MVVCQITWHPGLQRCNCIACGTLSSVLWLCQRAFLIVVNGGKPCGEATRLQLRVCGNGYKSMVLAIARTFHLPHPSFLTVLASGQNPLLSDTVITCANYLEQGRSLGLARKNLTATISVFSYQIGSSERCKFSPLSKANFVVKQERENTITKMSMF